MQIAWWRSKICPQARRRGVRGVQTNTLWRSICQFIWRPPPEDNAIAKFALRNGIVLLWVDNSVAHVVAPVYPSDLVICSQNNPHHWRCFLYRRSGFDKWSLERRKEGNTIWGDMGDTCLIHIDFWRCFQYKDSGAGELWGLSFCPEIPCSTHRVKSEKSALLSFPAFLLIPFHYYCNGGGIPYGILNFPPPLSLFPSHSG